MKLLTILSYKQFSNQTFKFNLFTIDKEKINKLTKIIFERFKKILLIYIKINELRISLPIRLQNQF